MDKVRDKKKFSIYSSMEEKEYLEAFLFLPGIFWERVLGLCLFLFVISITLYFLVGASFSEAFITTIALCIIIIISCILQKKKMIYKIYQDTYKNIDFHHLARIDFYDTYLITKSEYFTVKILYTKFTKIKEVDKYFYLFSPLQTVIIAKKDCNRETCTFIQSLPVKKYICKWKKGGNHLTKRKVLTEEKRDVHNEKALSILFWFLFFASILSVYGAYFTLSIFSEGIPASVSLTMYWICWLWLLFPVLSLILGFMYLRYSFSLKNIIIGALCSIGLLVVGGLSLIAPKPSYHFKEIKPYQNIIQVTIPKKAIYYHDDTFDFCFDSFIDISMLYVVYNDNDGDKLAQDIKNSDFWLDSYEAEELYDILPISLQSEYEDDYYLIFNKNTKQYNSFPNDDGKQSFIVMKYDSVYYRLYIYEYTLNYVK